MVTVLVAMLMRVAHARIACITCALLLTQIAWTYIGLLLWLYDAEMVDERVTGASHKSEAAMKIVRLPFQVHSN